MALKVYLQLKIDDHPQALDSFSDITKRVALEEATWSRDADGMSSEIQFSVFTILPYTDQHWSQYSGANDEAKIQSAIDDQGYRLQIPVRAEFYIEEDTTSERVFGGVVTAVDYAQESGYLIARISGGDYTQLLDEWVINRYSIPYASKDTDIILGNLVPNAYSGVATPSLFDYRNLARNIDEGNAAPDLNPLYYAVTQIQRTALGSYTSSIVSSIVTTDDENDFSVGDRVLITGTVGPSSEQGTFDFDGPVSNVLSSTAFVIASFPSSVSAAPGTVYGQSTAMARHDYIESASEVLFSPVYNEYGEARDIVKLERLAGSDRVYVETAAQAFATVETTPSAGYFYAVSKIQPASYITSGQLTALEISEPIPEGLTIAYVQPDTDPTGTGNDRLDGAASTIRVAVDTITKIGSTNRIRVTLQAGQTLEAKSGTLAYLSGYVLVKTGVWISISGRYRVAAIAADGGTSGIEIEAIDPTPIASIANSNWVKDVAKTDFKQTKSTSGIDGYMWPGVALAKGDPWVITGEDSESVNVTAASAAAGYISTSAIRSVKVDTSEITYVVNGSVTFTSGDFIKVVDVNPSAFNFGDTASAVKPKKVYGINKTYAVTGVTAAPTTISAANITSAVIGTTGAITFSYDDADPGFTVGNFVTISGASPAAYNIDFAEITAVVNQQRNVNLVIPANTTAASATSFDSAKVIKPKTGTSSVQLGYDQNNAGFAVGDYVSISGASTASINTGYARVVAINQEDSSISSAVASAQFTATENKVYAFTTNEYKYTNKDSGYITSPYASFYAIRYYFDVGTVPGISVGDIVTVSGITLTTGNNPYYNITAPRAVIKTGTAVYDGSSRPFIELPYFSGFPKNAARTSIIFPSAHIETIVKVGTVTYTTSGSHKFAINDNVKISGVSDASFDTASSPILYATSNTFTIIKATSGSSSGGVARNIRNYVTVEIPALINAASTLSISAAGATVSRVPVVKYRTTAVTPFNVGDLVTTESISSTAADVFNLTDQPIVAIETYASSSGYSRANNGKGNVFVISSSAQGTYNSGGVSYVERIRNAITVTVPAGNGPTSGTAAISGDRAGVITRIRTNTFTTSVAHPFKIGDYPKVAGTTSHNINASSQQYPIKKVTSTSFVAVSAVGTNFSGSASSREYYDSFKVARTSDQTGISSTLSVSSGNVGYAERVPVATYTATNHGFIVGNKVTITGVTPSDFNITDKEIIHKTANTFSVRDIEIITTGSTYTSGGSLSIASGNNNGSFVLYATPGMGAGGTPFVTYINTESTKDDSTPKGTKAASTRIKIEYSNIRPHGISKIRSLNGAVVGDSVKVYGTIKNGIITNASKTGSVVVISTSSHNIITGDRVKISNVSSSFDGTWTVTAVSASGVSPQTFTYSIPGSTGNDTKSYFENTPTWSVEFDSTADATTAIGVTEAERDSVGVVTITTASAHGISVNQRVNVSIRSGTKYEEMSGYQVIASVPDSNSVTYETDYASAVSINGVTGDIYTRDGYVVIDTPNESTIYARWTGTQEISQRSVTATINANVSVTDVIEISGTNNNDIDGQYRVVETNAVTFFGDNLPYGGYFEATPTVAGSTSAAEVAQGKFRKKQEISTSKYLEEYNGRTIRSAIDQITKRTNGQFWVDPYKNLRYKKRKIQNLITNPIFESSSGTASTSGWTLDAGFILDRDGDTGPYSTGYTLFSRGARRPWKKIQFEPISARLSQSNAVSLSEIQIIVSGSRLAAEIVSDHYGDPGVSAINDNNVESDWSSTNINQTVKPSVYLEYGSNKNIESYKLYTGNGSPDADPVSWNIYGINDGHYTLIDSQYQYPVTTDRGAIIGTFNLAPETTAKFTLTEGISVSPGKKYWVSARVKAENISAASLQVSFAIDDSSAKGGEVNVSGITVANEWQKLYTIVTVPAGKYKMYVSGVVSSDDAFAYFTDFIVTEINGIYGFSDNPSSDYAAINSAIPIKEYEIPEYSKEGAGVANTVYIYAAIIKADDVTAQGVIPVADGNADLTNNIENGDIDYSEKTAHISTMAVASNIVTVATTAAHGFYTDDYVTISSASKPDYNGTYRVTRVSDTSFTFSKTATNSAAVSVTDGTAKSSYSLRDWSVTGGEIAPSTDYEFSGSHSLLATTNSTTATNINVVYDEGSALTITPGDAYRFTIQSYIPVGQTKRSVDMYLYFYKDSQITQLAATASVTNLSQSVGQWKSMSVSGVAPTTAAYAKIEIVVKSTVSGESHYFDAAELVNTSYQQIYSYSFTDTKALWNSNGKVIERAEVNSDVATEEEVVLAAKSYFEGNPTGLESINFSFVYNDEAPEVGDTVPFIWRNMGIADVYVIKSVKSKLIGKEVFYEVQLTGDSELIGRGLLSGKRTAINVSNERDAGSRTINPPVYPYIRNDVNGGIQLNWLHSAGADDFEYSLWARSVPIGATQYLSSQYKLIAAGIAPIPVTDADLQNWGGDGTTITDLTISKRGQYTFRDFDTRYSYQFVIRASKRGQALYSQAAYIPEPGSPITKYITPPSSIVLSSDTTSRYGSIDQYADAVTAGSEEGSGPRINNIISLSEDGSEPVFSFDGRGISIYNAQEYTDGLGVTHEVGTRKILESSIDTGVTINADVINTGVLNANVVDVINLNANNIVAGTIDASQIDVINLNADNITSGTIAATELRVGTGANTVGLTADYLSGSAGYAFWAGTENPSSASPFSIQTDGSVVASNITIIGGSLDASLVTVTNLAADQIIVGSGSQTVGISPNYLSGTSGYAIWAGSSTPSSASPFSVTTDGNLVASNANIGGTISASAGSVGSWTIDAVSLTTVDSSGNYAGIYHSDDPSAKAFFTGASDASGTSASFSVTNDGVADFADINIRGGSLLSTAANFIAFATAFANGVVESAAISTAAITTAKIADAAIVTAKISTAAITSAKIESLESTKLTNVSGQPIIIASDTDAGASESNANDIVIASRDATIVASGAEAYEDAISGLGRLAFSGGFADIKKITAYAYTQSNNSTASPFSIAAIGAVNNPSRYNITSVSYSAGEITVVCDGNIADYFFGTTAVNIDSNIANINGFHSAVALSSNSFIISDTFSFTPTTVVGEAWTENYSYSSIQATDNSISIYAIDKTTMSSGFAYREPGRITIDANGTPAPGISLVGNIDVNSIIYSGTDASGGDGIYETSIIATFGSDGAGVSGISPDGSIIRFYADINMSSASNIVVDTGTVTSSKVRITSTSQSTIATGGSHALQIGSGSSENMRFDTNQIDVINNGAVADIYLQHYGGDVHIGQAAASTAGDIILGTSATNVTGAIIFKDGTGGSIRAFSTTSGNTSIAIKNSSGSAYTALVADGFFPGGQGSVSINHNGTNFTMNDTLAITGGITVSGNATFSGNVTIGNSTTDDITGTFLTNASSTNTYAIRWVYQGAAPSGLLVNQIYAHTSSRKYKDNIVGIPDSDSIIDVQPVSFQTKADIAALGESAPTQYGYIAEEMAENPMGMRFVNYNQDGSAEAVQYDMLAPALASAMRSIRNRIVDLERRLAELESAD